MRVRGRARAGVAAARTYAHLYPETVGRVVLDAVVDPTADAVGHVRNQATGFQRAISCADAKARPKAAEARALVPEFREISPVFGPFLAWDTAGWCAGWPVEGEHDTPEASAPGSAPVLVIGTTGDPATPYEGARRMAEELGEGVGVMLTNKGEGHGSYGESTCVTSVVDAYFLHGEVPADGRTCS